MLELKSVKFTYIQLLLLYYNSNAKNILEVCFYDLISHKNIYLIVPGLSFRLGTSLFSFCK